MYRRRLKVQVELVNTPQLDLLKTENADLKKQLIEKDREIYRLRLMVSQSIRYIDMINQAREDLKSHGLDYSYLQLR